MREYIVENCRNLLLISYCNVNLIIRQEYYESYYRLSKGQGSYNS